MRRVIDPLLAPTVLFAGLFGLALGCASVTLETLRRAVAALRQALADAAAAHVPHLR